MDFATAIKTCWEKYATFTGRASRSEYWYFVLFILIGALVCGMLDLALFPTNQWSPLSSIFSLVTFLPSIAVAARRLHDIDKSGWRQLIVLIPLIGIIIFVIWMCRVGTSGPNLYGSDPMPAAVPA